MPLSQINSASIENASIAIVDLSATGTPSSTTFLRGDNTWSAPAGGITSGTTVASTSGTSIDFTGIPSTAKRITVMFNGVSLSGSANGLVQLGSGSIETSGYLGGATIQYVGTIEAANATNGLLFPIALSSRVVHGCLVINSMNNNLWCSFGSFGFSNAAGAGVSGGSKTLSGAIDRIRITTTNGTDTFDAGSVNILYE
jgi:hypothetical protein